VLYMLAGLLRGVDSNGRATGDPARAAALEVAAAQFAAATV
jgi:hypothetical protein